MAKNSQRSWVSPFVAVTFAAMSFTGILMFFHLKFPGVYAIHKWGGLVFVAAGGFHLMLNWRPFVAHFKNRNAALGALTGILVLIFLAMAFPAADYGHGRSGYKAGQHYRSHNPR